jgi:hypothetical protein
MVGLGPQNGHTVLGVVGVRESDIVPDGRQKGRKHSMQRKDRM